MSARPQRDAALLRVYAYYGAAAGAMTAVVYAVLLPQISALYIFAVVVSLVYQAYVVMLVLSLIVELKLQESIDKNGTSPAPDVETPDEAGVNPGPVETTAEHVNERTPHFTPTPTVPETVKASGTTEKASTEFKVIGSGTKLKINSTTVKVRDAAEKPSGATAIPSSCGGAASESAPPGGARGEAAAEGPSAGRSAAAGGSAAGGSAAGAGGSGPAAEAASVPDHESAPTAKARGRFWRRK